MRELRESQYERGNPIDSIDEKLSYIATLAICGTTSVRSMYGYNHLYT